MRRREASSLLTAVVLHVAILVGAQRIPSSRLVARAPGAIDDTIEVAIDVPPEPPRPPSERAGEATAGDAAHERSELPPSEGAPRRRTVRGPGPGTSLEPGEPPGSVVPPTSPDSSGGEAYDAPEGPPLPGLGGRPVYTLPGVLPPAAPAPAPTEAPRAARPDKDTAGRVLTEAMQARDKAIGLDLPAAGTVASAVREAVKASNTPGAVRATFEVRLGADGRVLGVRVVRSSGGDAGEWARAAKSVLATLAGRGLLAMGALSAGAVVLVDALSDLALPAGKSGGLAPGGATFDLSNIGAHAARVVKTSFVVIPAR